MHSLLITKCHHRAPEFVCPVIPLKLLFNVFINDLIAAIEVVVAAFPVASPRCDGAALAARRG